jgi:cell wall-associated NlpC family hydrolase
MSAIVSTARSYLGVRWLHQGRSRSGLDCAGLVIRVAQDLGITDFDTRGYDRQAADESMLAICREHLVAIERAELAAGDILVMAYQNQRHIGIVGDHPAGGLTLIHAYAPSRKVVEMRLDDRLTGRVIGCFRFPREGA